MAAQKTQEDHKPSRPRDKYRSPPPPLESMTPPPTSRAPVLASAAQLVAKERSPTPPPSAPPQLSSPPRTGRRPRAVDYGIFTAQQVDAASPEERKAMVAGLARELRSARASAAHYRLQCEWAHIECDKAVEGMGVELDMARREMRVLQHHQAQTPRAASADEQQLAHWRHACAVKESDICILRDALEHQTLVSRAQLEDRDAELADALAETAQLRERIRENRSHVNLWRGKSSGDAQATATATATATTTPMPRTPARQLTARDPYQTPISKPRGREGLDALILATDSVERHQVNSMPSTPAPYPSKRQGLGHRRASQSLSSIQLSPAASRTAPQPPRAQQPRRYVAGQSNLTSPIRQQPHTPAQRRRQSRDSTISDDGPETRQRQQQQPQRAHQPPPDYEVYESRASQAATDILRRSASSSFARDEHSARAGPRSSVDKVSAKLYGAVTKQALGKHQSLDDEAGDVRSAKKIRADDGVGLGIGSWAASPSR